MESATKVAVDNWELLTVTYRVRINMEQDITGYFSSLTPLETGQIPLLILLDILT